MKLLFVNRFYWPETPATGQLLTDLAEGLAALGHEVTVVTARHRADAPTRETRAGVVIRRVCGTPRMKPLAFARFHLAAFFAVRRWADRETAVVVMTDPPLIGISTGWAASSRKALCIQWIQDIYPEIAVRLTRHRWLSILTGPRNASWRRAERCVTLGEDMSAVVRGSGVDSGKIVVQHNWGPAGVSSRPREIDSPLRRAWGLSGKFVVAYSGNLGRVHDLGPLLRLADLLRDDPEFAFVFIGSGAGEADIRRGVESRGLQNVLTLPPQPREELSSSLAVADVHAVTLLPGCEGLVFPSKLHGVAAAGRPVLFIGPEGCDVARAVRGNGLGICVTRDNLPLAVRELQRLAADPVRWENHASASRGFGEIHSATAAIESWQRLLADPGKAGSGDQRTLPASTLTESCS